MLIKTKKLHVSVTLCYSSTKGKEIYTPHSQWMKWYGLWPKQIDNF